MTSLVRYENHDDAGAGYVVALQIERISEYGYERLAAIHLLSGRVIYTREPIVVAVARLEEALAGGGDERV